MKSFLTSVTRRAFLSRAVIGALGVRPVLRGPGAAPSLHVGIIEGDDRDRLDGALLGAEEARHAAALFGGAVQLTKISEAAASYRFILGDDDADRCARLARAALLMNVACASDALRGTKCAPLLFHVAPSRAMRQDAARLAGIDAGIDAGAQAWDASLQRFGADTLNQRFRARFGRPMNASAWTAWMAMKILWESCLRARSVEMDAIAAYLSRDATQFDGHKGRPLSFRVWDRQLRQPLYVRAGARVIELPADGGADESPRAALDRLGTPAAQSSCRSAP